MTSSLRPLVFFVFFVNVILSVVVYSACGPRHLSALGNPGDFCTEESSCTDGSECRPTDDGYRCVGGPNDRPSVEARVDEDDEEAETGNFSVESGGEEGDGGTMEFEESEDSQGGNDEYLPPSRRRRGGR